MEDSWEKARTLRQWLKVEWADLWESKLDDRVRAEDVSVKEYTMLFVESGEIVRATRDFKPLSFTEVFERHVGKEKAEGLVVDPQVGGWRKFARENFPAKGKIKITTTRKRPKVKVDLSQQQRKHGAGWLNQARIRKKVRLNTSNDT